MTLYELSGSYRAGAAAIRVRIRTLREEEREQSDADSARQLRARIAALEPLLREMREMAILTERYYERGYYRSEQYRL